MVLSKPISGSRQYTKAIQKNRKKARLFVITKRAFLIEDKEFNLVRHQNFVDDVNNAV